MLDGHQAHITDIGHQNLGKTDMIMTQIREESPWRGVAAGPGRR